MRYDAIARDTSLITLGATAADDIRDLVEHYGRPITAEKVIRYLTEERT